MHILKGKTIIITGASRGIGKAIALKCAGFGANIVAVAKTLKGHSKLPGSLSETVEVITKSAGNAIAVQVDVQREEHIQRMVDEAVGAFGGIDILINNAGAVSLTPVEKTSLKLFERMYAVNYRAAFLCSQAVIPYQKKSNHAHILTISPPINLKPKWFKDYSPYTISKYSMSMLTIGLAEELKVFGIAVNSLWPKTTIATAAIEYAVGNKEMLNVCRTVNIMADAACDIIKTGSLKLTGQLLIDEDVLLKAGARDFDQYAYNKKFKDKLYPDLFVD